MRPEEPAGYGQQQKIDTRPDVAAGPDSRPVYGMPTRRTVLHPTSLLKAIAVCFTLLLLAGALTGCGSGVTAFTGGGVPIGGASLTGRVVAANNVNTVVPNVAIRVNATPSGGTTRVLETVTDKDGAFVVANVLPGFSNGTVQLTAVPSGPDYKQQQVAFSITGGRTQQMLVTLPPVSFDATKAASVTLTVGSSAIPTGGSVSVAAAVRDVDNNPLGVTPTLVLDGNFARINADGSVGVPTGITSGSGTLVAYWQGLRSPAQQIHADPNAPSSPPTPPILPTNTDK